MQANQRSRPPLFLNSSSQSPKNRLHQNQPRSAMGLNQGANYVYQPQLKANLQASPNSHGEEMDFAYNQRVKSPQRFEVYMRCVTWGRDSHGLFDYESRQIAKRNIKTYTGGKIIRLNNDVEFISKYQQASDFDPSAKPLIIVHEKNGKFFVENDTLVALTHGIEEGAKTDEDVNNKMFTVVRNIKSTQSSNNDYRLKKGDIIKLGRIKFKVKDFRTDLAAANCDQNKRQSYSPVKKGAFQDEEYWVGGEDFSEEAIEIDCGVVDATQSDIQCKVCWSNDQSLSNPLLNSCKCDGSVRYIHYECLKHWLKQKMNVKEEDNLVSYTWKQFECEICKKPYPYIFKSNGQKYRLVDVDIPEERNFLWLESLTFEKNSSRMVHLIMPNAIRSVFKLGRGHESDVRVSDISVSRCHAILKYNESDHSYYLEDNLSKFGTLVLAKQAIELDVEQTKAVQIGRSVISFTVKPSAEVKEALRAQSPIASKHESAVKSSVEELLRIQIEETNSKINRIINLNNKQEPKLLVDDQVDSPNLSSYMQSFQNSNPSFANGSQFENQIAKHHQQLLRERLQLEAESRVQASQQQSFFHQDRESLSNTLQRFEKMIQSVEQRLAERDSRYVQQPIRPASDNSCISPVRNPTSYKATYHHQYNLSGDHQMEQEEEDESILKTQHKKQSMKYEGIGNRNLALNPEHLYEFCDSPFQGNDCANQGADESISLTLNQLKNKYGGQPDYFLEDRKKEFYNDSYDQEDQPLRMKSSNHNHQRDSPVRIDLASLMQGKIADNGQNRNGSNLAMKTSYNQSKYLNNYSGASQNYNLFAQSENKPHHGRDKNELKQGSYLSQSPSKGTIDQSSRIQKTYYEGGQFSHHHTSITQQPSIITGQSASKSHLKSSKPSSTTIQTKPQHRFASPEKKEQSSQLYKYNDQSQRRQNTYKRTSSQSPWRVGEDTSDQVTSNQNQKKQSEPPAKANRTLTAGSSRPHPIAFNQSPSKSSFNPNNVSSSYAPSKGQKSAIYKDSSVGRQQTIQHESGTYQSGHLSKTRKQNSSNAGMGSGTYSGVTQTLYQRQHNDKTRY